MKEQDEQRDKINPLYARLLNAIRLGVNIVDEDLNIVYLNKTLEDCDACPLKKPLKAREFEAREVEGALGGRTLEVTHRVIDFRGKKAVLEIFADITERKQVEQEKSKLLIDLSERVKELNCLYNIAKIVETPNISLEEMLRKTVDVLPPGWQYPDIACARIMAEGREFKTTDFRETKWKQAADIMVHGKKAGAVEVYYLEEKPESDEGPFLKEERDLIEAIAERLGRIAERQQAEEALSQSEEKFRTLFENASEAIFIHDLEGHFLEVNRLACERLGYSREELLRMMPRDINVPEYAALFPKRVEELRQRGHFVIETAHVRRDGTVIHTEMSSRIIDYGGRPAVITFARDITERKQAEEELRLGHSLEQLRRTLEGTVNALATMTESRDPYTAGHQRRVTQLACAIAKEMGLSVEQVDAIHMAALVHDVGKMSVPSEILTKPSRLTEIEFEMVKTHPKVGYVILETVEFSGPVAEIVLQHQERMDGSGYPAGLSGEAILPEARILAVADVVEAMFSHRPYRPALGRDEALLEVSQKKGVLYEPKAVDACLKIFTEQRFEFEQVIEQDSNSRKDG